MKNLNKASPRKSGRILLLKTNKFQLLIRFLLKTNTFINK